MTNKLIDEKTFTDRPTYQSVGTKNLSIQSPPAPIYIPAENTRPELRPQGGSSK